MLGDVRELIVRLRNERNISAPKLAELSGVSQPTIWRIEHMETTPDLETLEKILSVLGYKVDVIAKEEPQCAP
jgi:transcriptional regulator with XRE-family HTH domain